MPRRAVFCIALLLAEASCIDSSRINRTCTWVETSGERLDLSNSRDRDHLRADVQVAADLAVRFGDAASRARADIGGPRQRACTAEMIDSIARRHDIPRERIVEAEYARVWWVDLLVVYLPLAV